MFEDNYYAAKNPGRTILLPSSHHCPRCSSGCEGGVAELLAGHAKRDYDVELRGSVSSRFRKQQQHQDLSVVVVCNEIWL